VKHYKYILLTTLVVCLTIQGWSQNRIIDSNFNTWWSNINKYNISNNWFLSSELHIRRANGLSDWQQFLFRPALNYKLNSPVVLTLGYTYIKSYPYGNQPIAILTPENNLWEQITLKHQSGKFKISHRYRFEQRFIGKTNYTLANEPIIKGHVYTHRFRYRLTMSIPLSSNKKMFAKGFDEVWVNLENNLMPVGLNQNWLYAGLGYKINSRANFQIGYMNQLVKKGDGIHYENNQTIQVTIGYDFFKHE